MNSDSDDELHTEIKDDEVDNLLVDDFIVAIPLV